MFRPFWSLRVLTELIFFLNYLLAMYNISIHFSICCFLWSVIGGFVLFMTFPFGTDQKDIQSVHPLSTDFFIFNSYK